MAVRLEAHCRQCGVDSEAFRERSLALAGEDPGEPPRELPHPGEQAAVAAEGETLTALARAGRLVSVTRGLCHGCGRVVVARRLVADSLPGCGITAAGAALSGGVAGALAGSAWAGVFAGVAAAGLLLWWTSARRTDRVRARFPEQAARFDGRAWCDSCGGPTRLSASTRRRYPCPRCGVRACRVREAPTG